MMLKINRNPRVTQVFFYQGLNVCAYFQDSRILKAIPLNVGELDEAIVETTPDYIDGITLNHQIQDIDATTMAPRPDIAQLYPAVTATLFKLSFDNGPFVSHRYG